jgi:hypothetical protein
MPCHTATAGGEQNFSVDDPFSATYQQQGAPQSMGNAGGAAGGQLYVPPLQPPAAPNGGSLV